MNYLCLCTSLKINGPAGQPNETERSIQLPCRMSQGHGHVLADKARRVTRMSVTPRLSLETRAMCRSWHHTSHFCSVCGFQQLNGVSYTRPSLADAAVISRHISRAALSSGCCKVINNISFTHFHEGRKI